MSTTEMTPYNGNGQATAHTSNLPAFNSDAVMRALNLNPNDVRTQALVLTCERYGLDPLLSHAVLIQGKLYVTRDGLLHVAHSSGKFDGIEVEVMPETATHHIAVCTVWRKDMSRAFRYPGRYPKSGQMAVKYGPEMATKVAECMALRRAFDVSIGSREEMWDTPIDAPTTAESVGPQEYHPPRNVSPAGNSEPRYESPEPSPDLEALRSVKRAFGSEAKRLKVFKEICDTEGKPSPELATGLLCKIFLHNDIPFNGDDTITVNDWVNGTKFMAEYIAWRKANPAMMPQPLTPVVTESGQDDYLADKTDDDPLPESPFEEERAAASGLV